MSMRSRSSPRALSMRYCMKSHRCNSSLMLRRRCRNAAMRSSYCCVRAWAAESSALRRCFSRRRSAFSVWLSRVMAAASASLMCTSPAWASLRRRSRSALALAMRCFMAAIRSAAFCRSVASSALTRLYSSEWRMQSISLLMSDMLRSVTLKCPSGCWASNTGGTK